MLALCMLEYLSENLIYSSIKFIEFCECMEKCPNQISEIVEKKNPPRTYFTINWIFNDFRIISSNDFRKLDSIPEYAHFPVRCG